MCYKCKKPVTETAIFKTSSCPHCGADLHSCVNCKFYSPGSHYDCHETVDEEVKDKERGNFCDSFKINQITGESDSKADDSKQKARDAFNALFS